MKSAPKKRSDPPMRKQYDFSGGVVGKYSKRYREGTNVVRIIPDVADASTNSKSPKRASRPLVVVNRRKAKKRT